MSAVDVLAVMNDCRNDLDAARMVVAAKELAKARAAVAELIEASRALQDAMDENDSNKFDIGPATRFLAADKRHRAALARVGGAA